MEGFFRPGLRVPGLFFENLVYTIDKFTFVLGHPKSKLFIERIKNVVFLLLLACLLQTGYTQTAIKGSVRNNKGKAIYGVNISLKETYDGATTDSSGNFSFLTTEKGEQILVASSVGYKPYEQIIKLQGEPLHLIITLKEEITELDAVTISAGTFEASDRKRASAVLDPIDIVTTASANGDITGALKTLPGAQQVGESEGLFVRSGTAAETKTFIDGTLVNNFFYRAKKLFEEAIKKYEAFKPQTSIHPAWGLKRAQYFLSDIK